MIFFREIMLPVSGYIFFLFKFRVIPETVVVAGQQVVFIVVEFHCHVVLCLIPVMIITRDADTVMFIDCIIHTKCDHMGEWSGRRLVVFGIITGRTTLPYGHT